MMHACISIMHNFIHYINCTHIHMEILICDEDYSTYNIMQLFYICLYL